MNIMFDFIKRELRNRSVYLCLVLFFLFSGCKDDDGDEPVINQDNQYVNNWILQNMEEVYLWNDEIPAGVDLNLPPDEYFSDLLTDEDRFSWIQENYQELLNSLKGVNKEAGFEFVLYKEGSENVIAQILYIKPSSPAENAGLKRGDVITKINGQTLTVSNYKELIQEFKENHTIVYKPIVVGEDRFDSEATVSLTVTEYAEDPNHLSKVITEGERKIGYYVYNLFSTGPTNESSQYDDEMDQIFSTFKSEGITDLVLDLRFNSGGSEVSAKNLASLIVPGVNETKLYFSKVYNENVMEQIQNDPDLGDSFLKIYFEAKNENIGDLLSLQRVYILTSSRTASASELVINGLNPYMDVYLIGDVTYGKNVGSTSIYKESDPKNTWGMQPIIVKVSNSDGASDYSNGFMPDIENKDNGLYIYPLGDVRENLLKEAIAHITGVVIPGRKTLEEREMIGHSLDTKRSSYTLMMER